MTTEKPKRGRPRAGSVYEHGDHFDVRITYPDGTRSNPRCLPAGTSHAKARETARAMTERAAEQAAAPTAPAKPTEPAPVTWASWTERWAASREERGMRTSDNLGHFRKWVPEATKAKPMADIERVDLERIVEGLDAAVIAELITWKTAINAWGTITKMFVDAVRSKKVALRVLTVNPCVGIAGPDRGAKKGKVYLYPTEFLALMNCPRIPIRWKRLFALAVYLYQRPGELEATHLEDIDLERRVLHVHRAIDHESDSGEFKETKTKSPRHIPIEVPVVPLLKVLIDEARERESPLLFDMPPMCDLSGRLRQYLVWAGVTRAELFADDRTRKHVTFYDLRATGITWMALRGDDALRIMQRAGHEDLKTTMGYVREAENLAHALGPDNVFPALPFDVISSGIASEGPAVWGKLRESQWKKKRPQRDLNPRNSLERAGSWAGLDDGDRCRGART